VVKKALIFFLLSLVTGLPAKADVQSESCQELSALILQKYAAIQATVPGNNGRLTKEQAVEVNELFGVACSPQYSQCGFSACKGGPEPEQRNASVNPETNPTEESPPTPDAAISLPWVTEDMTCETFLSQLRTRYQAGNLDEDKKKELKLALELACGEKFKHCNFEACKKTNSLE